MAVTIKDHTFDAKRFSPLVYDEKIINYSKTLKPGTLAYDDFWDEQDDRCLFGFTPKGMHHITGEHYFYLNMNQIEMLPQGESRKRPHAPYYRELDNRLFSIVYDAKTNKYGLVIGKPRRVGLSWFGANNCTYEMVMNFQNRVGICAGKKNKATAFYNKVIYLLNNLRPEYQTSILRKNDELLKLGYMDIVNRQEIESGIGSEMLVRTMFADSAGFEGESMSVVVFEEAGLFQNLIQSFKSTEPCFREGAIQFGTPLIYGTGGEIEKGSKGYMEIWHEHKSYNLEKVFIPAYEYFPGDGEVDEKTGIQAPSFFDVRTGRTDQEAALKHILAERKMAAKSKSGLTKHIQNYPIKESEIFIKSKGGMLNREKLNDQLILLDEGRCPYDIQQGRLEWVDDEMTTKLIQRCKNTKEQVKIRIERGVKVRWVEDEKYGTILRLPEFQPINNDDMDHKPDIAACDSYDEEVEEGGGSNGATLVYRTYAGPSREYDIPIMVLCERGEGGSDDVFYENNVKMAVYWNYELLFEYSKIAIEGYFKDVGAEKYLKKRPDLRQVLGPTKAKNEYGQRMPKEVKALLEKLLKAEVNKNSGNMWFRNMLIDLIDFGDKNTDIAMAYGIILLYKLELFDQIMDEDDYYDEFNTGDNLFDQMTYYEVNSRGEVEVKTFGGLNPEQLQVFDPEREMTERDRMELKQKAKDKQKELDDHRKTVQEKRKTLMIDLIQEEIERSSKYS